jgi:hypothetical protein
MNERIKELIEQATKHYPATPSSGEFSTFDKEKFAELIVNHATECVRDVLREEDSELTYTAAAQVQKRIKEHFGVEE